MGGEAGVAGAGSEGMGDEQRGGIGVAEGHGTWTRRAPLQLHHRGDTFFTHTGT